MEAALNYTAAAARKTAGTYVKKITSEWESISESAKSGTTIEIDKSIAIAKELISTKSITLPLLEEFNTALRQANGSFYGLSSFSFKNESILRSAIREMGNILEKIDTKGYASLISSDLTAGNIIFRNGSMLDKEILDLTKVVVLSISTSGEVDKNSLSTANQLEMTSPPRLLLGQSSIVSLPSGKTGPILGVWACSHIQGQEPEYGAIETICRTLTQKTFNFKRRFIAFPLFDSESGKVGLPEIINIYVKAFNELTKDLKILVSISSQETFQQVSSHIKAEDTNSQPTPPINTDIHIPGNSFQFLELEKDQPDIKSRLISDTFTTDETDVLQYDVIAQNLFAILTDKGTNPPLNIGIFAPWGRGKTSLMKRLQAKFKEASKAELKIREAEWTVQTGGEKHGPSYGTSRKLAGWRAALRWLRHDKIDIRPKLPYVTVWFNPWNYQSSDMIWAGMADAVINQVVDQIPSKPEKEIFWVQLQMARLAKEKIRKDVQKKLVFYASQLAFWGVLVLLGFFFFTLNKVVWSVIGFAGISGFVTTLIKKIDPLSKAISEGFDKYSETPKYQEKTGTFHEVQVDLNKVLKLCIDEEKPMVIFVDDLDRCSPSKVVEVIEAINVFISGDFNTKCYFILGMDGEMVAGALDASYEKMKGKLGSREMDQGSIGWYFLDKFIQLPYFIPVMSESKKKEYLRNLLSENEASGNGAAGGNGETGAAYSGAENKGGAPAKAPVPVDEAKVKEVVERVIATSDNQVSSQLIKEASLSREEQKELDKLILQNQVESQKQNELIMEQVSAYAPFISSDPRSLKRFANLLRFYCAYQFLRMKKGQRYAEAPILAKWLAIMLKFPQLVRWIQWDSENKAGIHTAAEEKVKLLDELVEAYCKNSEDQEFSRWLAHELPATYSHNGKAFSIYDYPEMPWLRSQKLFAILMNEKAGDSSFRNTLECNVW